MNEDYERGYREGVSHIRSQLSMMHKDLQFIRDKRGQMTFFLEAKDKPKPGLTLWLILDSGAITEGVYLNGAYLTMSGMLVTPLFWAIIPDRLKKIVGADDAKPSLPRP